MVQVYKKIICWNIEIFSIVIKTLFMIPRGCCRFSPSCTEFSKEAVIKLPINKAIPAMVIRLLKCHPFNKGGYNPVIEETHEWKNGIECE
jgi:putative membrane protein insertion efficiency factor